MPGSLPWPTHVFVDFVAFAGVITSTLALVLAGACAGAATGLVAAQVGDVARRPETLLRHEGGWEGFWGEIMKRRDSFCWGLHGSYDWDAIRDLCCRQEFGPRGGPDCWNDYLSEGYPWDANLESYEFCCRLPNAKLLWPSVDSGGEGHDTAATSARPTSMAPGGVGVVLLSHDGADARRFWPLAFLGIARHVPLRQLGWRLYFITEGRQGGVQHLAKEVGLGSPEIFRWLAIPRASRSNNFVSSMIAALEAVPERWVLSLQEDVAIPAPLDPEALAMLVSFAQREVAASVYIARGTACSRWPHLKSVHNLGRFQIVEAESVSKENDYLWSHSLVLHDRYFQMSMLALAPGRGFHRGIVGRSDSQESQARRVLKAMASDPSPQQRDGLQQLFQGEETHMPMVRVFGVEYPGGLGGMAADAGTVIAWAHRSCPCFYEGMCRLDARFRCIELQSVMNQFGCLHGPADDQLRLGLDEVVYIASGGRTYEWFASAGQRVRRLLPPRERWRLWRLVGSQPLLWRDASSAMAVHQFCLDVVRS